MSKSCFRLNLFALLILLNFSTLFAQETIGPRMVPEEKIFNVKDVKEGDIIEHEFKISNLGDEILNIEKVDPG